MERVADMRLAYKGIMAAIVAAILVLSITAGVGGFTYFYKSGEPKIEITSLSNNDVVPAGLIEIRGTASLENGAIKAISVIVEGDAPVPANVRPADDFVEWSAIVTIPDMGSHTIEVEALDSSGKTSLTEASILVREPSLVLAKIPDKTVEATGPSGAVVRYPAPDILQELRNIGAPSCTPDSGHTFPMGTTTVTCTATYRAGTVSSSFTITVGDSTPPTIAAPDDVIVKNAGLAFTQISLGNPAVDDNVDPAPSLSNNAPREGFGLGTTTVLWTASDKFGNEATVAQKVTVMPASDEGKGATITYGTSGGGGGSGGGGSSKPNKVPQEESKYELTINSVDLAGSELSMPAIISSSNGNALKTGSTPLTFDGNSEYVVTASNSGKMAFDHWENGDTAAARTVKLSKDVVLTAYYRSVPQNEEELSVEITKPVADSTVTLKGNTIKVEGRTADNGNGIAAVEVRVDDDDYVQAIPNAQGDWSSWTVTLEVTPGERRLVPRVTDEAGNQVWNSIHVTFAGPSDGGGGGGSGSTLDDFGIEKIYPTVQGGNEWYVNMADPDSDPMFRNLPSMTKQSDGSWRVSASQVRMEAWSPANEKWLNVEITMYAKMISGSNELLQLYSRGGHHTSSNECLGSAYKARFYGDGDAAWVKEVTHPAYAGNRGTVSVTDTSLADRWIGLKAVIHNIVENGKTYVRMESYIDDDVTDSNGNLKIANNWKLASVVEDKGGWSTGDSDFNSTCAPVNKDSTQRYRQRDEILNTSGGTNTQNIAAFRSDDLTWNWKYLTVREIVPPS